MLLCVGDMMKNKIILLVLLALGVVLVSGCTTSPNTQLYLTKYHLNPSDIELIRAD